MKYTDRKRTPLKWHHVLMFVILPVIILLRLYVTLGLTSELMGLDLPYVTNYLELILSASGVLITNLGSWFWPVAGLYIVEILLLIWSIVIWIEMLRWRNKGRIQWNIYLLVQLLFSAALTYICYERLVVQEHYLIFLPLLASIHLIPTFMAAHLPLFIATLMGFTLLWLLFLILNIVYYHKRKKLFAAHYTRPEEVTEEKKENTSTEADASNEKQSDVIEQKEDSSEETNSSRTETEVSPKEEPAVTDKETSTDSEQSESEKDNDVSEDMLYCPNCGARLTKYDQNYCTHCGAKLHD